MSKRELLEEYNIACEVIETLKRDLDIVREQRNEYRTEIDELKSRKFKLNVNWDYPRTA